MVEKRERGGTNPSLFLINPRLKYKHYVAQEDICRSMGKKIFCPPLALPLIASLTPKRYVIRIIDEEMEDLPAGETPDIAGITTHVSTSRRAFEIADAYRSRGAVVVMGGTYATYMTQETLKHADSVVVGEAEGAWERLLEDFERGEMEKVYRSDHPSDYRSSPVPRWDLLDTGSIMAIPVQVSRGCPFRCEFCLVNRMFGNRQRYRDIDDVLGEIDALPIKKIFFVDDNFTADKSYASALMKRLQGRGLSWACQASLDVADDEELLESMAEAGCFSMIVGLESVNPESLRETHKLHNRVEKYERAIGRIHAHGMHVTASFIVGFDADGPDAFDRIHEFALKNNLWFIMLSPLTATPGTDLYERMQKEGRILPLDTDLINGVFPNIRSRNMPAAELFDRYFEMLGKTVSYEIVRQKALRLFDGGSFSRPETGEIGFGEKFLTTMSILNRFLLTGNRAKRRLFLDLFAMVRRKKITPDKVVLFLLSVEGFNEWLRSSGSYRSDVREALERVDGGPRRGPVTSGGPPS